MAGGGSESVPRRSMAEFPVPLFEIEDQEADGGETVERDHEIGFAAACERVGIVEEPGSQRNRQTDRILISLPCDYSQEQGDQRRTQHSDPFRDEVQRFADKFVCDSPVAGDQLRITGSPLCLKRSIRPCGRPAVPGKQGIPGEEDRTGIADCESQLDQDRYPGKEQCGGLKRRQMKRSRELRSPVSRRKTESTASRVNSPAG